VIIATDLPGDLWRGGACIFMRDLLKAYDVRNRRVFDPVAIADGALNLAQ